MSGLKKAFGVVDFSYIMYRHYSNWMKQNCPHALKKDFQGDLLEGMFAKNPEEIADYIVSKFIIDIELLKGKNFILEPLVICFDCGKSEVRKKLLPDYKGQRKNQMSQTYLELKNIVFPKTVEIIKELCPEREWIFMEKLGVEADDLIAVTTKLLIKNEEKIIFASDRDLLQLIDEKTSWITYNNDNSIKHITLENFHTESKTSKCPAYRNPQQFLEGKYLCGDKGDNIKGVPMSDTKNIGDKGAWSMIQKYGSIENIYNDIVIDDSNKVRSEDKMLAGIKSKKGKSIIEFNKKLMDISYISNTPQLVQYCIGMFNQQVNQMD